MRWAEVPAAAYAPQSLRGAREISARLFALYPQARTLSAMFATVVREISVGRLPVIAYQLEPSLAEVTPDVAREGVRVICAHVLQALFRGALLEHGAEVEPSLGDPSLVFRFQGTRFLPDELAVACFEDPHARATIERWAASLARGQPPSIAPSLPPLGSPDATMRIAAASP